MPKSIETIVDQHNRRVANRNESETESNTLSDKLYFIRRLKLLQINCEDNFCFHCGNSPGTLSIVSTTQQYLLRCKLYDVAKMREKIEKLEQEREEQKAFEELKLD